MENNFVAHHFDQKNHLGGQKCDPRKNRDLGFRSLDLNGLYFKRREWGNFSLHSTPLKHSPGPVSIHRRPELEVVNSTTHNFLPLAFRLCVMNFFVAFFERNNKVQYTMS